MTQKLHFKDLTQITAPFGLLDDDTQERLKAWPYGVMIFCNHAVWAEVPNPDFDFIDTYRAHPGPLTHDVVPWNQIPSQFNWAARDKSGQAYIFSEMPTPDYAIGEWLGGGAIHRFDHIHTGYERGNCDWRGSLQRRPEGV